MSVPKCPHCGETRESDYDWLAYHEKDCELTTLRANVERQAEEIERLNEKLACGHRKVDMDDSYGGCIFCIIVSLLPTSSRS